MDKKTIRSFLAEVRSLMREGKFIRAYDKLGFVLKELNAQNRSKVNSK